MRKAKRIVALVMVALFLFSFAVAPAMAQTKEDAFGRLKALSVAIGDATGNPQYDKNFTRAEAAAIMVNLLGENAAIAAAKGNTKFKDVPASHWASGVVNLAVGAGVIKGYPDGTFKPEANVTYAEMSAMLVQVLGYGPKLTGTWPSNVIGKAAQLGLLDNVSVTDYNAAAVRGNVFIAADNSLTVYPLIENNNGYEEDTKTLMEKKLSVTKKDEATVTATPGYSSATDKNKVTLTYTGANHSPASETLDTTDTLNPDDYFGLRVEAWVKDDKVFFLDIQNNDSDIITDTIKEFKDVNGNVLGTKVLDPTVQAPVASIRLDATDKVVSVAYGSTSTQWYKNFSPMTMTNTIGLGTTVKVILGSDGKAAYVLGTAAKQGMVDSIDTANEKINFKSDASSTGSLTLKDTKYKVFRDGAPATLADLKKGDILDYIDNTNLSQTSMIWANDKSDTGKITGVLDNGLAKDGTYETFKFQVGDKQVDVNKSFWYSTDNGDSYTYITPGPGVLTSAFNSIINKDVTFKYAKSGKITHVIAGSASSDSDIPVVVKYVKRVTTTDSNTYIYVAKFDGTQTYYQVTKDTKIDGVKVNESALKNSTDLNPTNNNNSGDGNWIGQAGARLVPTTQFNPATTSNDIKTGDVVKLNLNADGTVNEIKHFTNSDVQLGTDFRVSKDNSTIVAAGTVIDGSGTNATPVTLSMGDDTKVIKVKAAPSNGGSLAAVDVLRDGSGDYIDDVDTVSVTTLKAIDGLGTSVSSNATADVTIVKDGGTAKYILLEDNTVSVTSSSFFGIVLGLGTNANGNSYVTLGHDGKTEDIEGSLTGSASADGNAAAKQGVISYTLGTDGKINGNTVPTAVYPFANGNTPVYNYRVDSVVNGNQLKLYPVDANWSDIGTSAVYVLVDTAKTQYWDIHDSNTTNKVALNDVIGHYVKVFDMWDSNGNLITSTGSAYPGAQKGDGVVDFVTIVKN